MPRVLELEFAGILVGYRNPTAQFAAGAGLQSAIDDGHGEAGPDEHRADVGVTVIVMPGFFMEIRTVYRSDLLQGGGQVVTCKPGLKFRCRNRGRGTDHKHRSDPTGNGPRVDALDDLLSDVEYLAVAFRLDLNGMRFYAHQG